MDVSFASLYASEATLAYHGKLASTQKHQCSVV